MELKLSGDYILKIESLDSGIPDHRTVELSAMYPLAQTPRWQRLTQLTVTEPQAIAIARAISPPL